MPVNSKTFSQLVTFSRASGATRVNSAGLVVGVDFSSTSNTIGTGSKTFTLAATAGVNRDWPTSSAIRAVDQVGGGTMIGTVTSYNASTQELVINVASITGSGTSTNWRIGSLEFRRDFDPVTLAPRGGLVEGQATNNFTFSQDFSNAAWTKTGVTITPGFLAPDGSLTAFRLQATAGVTGTITRNGAFAGLGNLSLFVKDNSSGAANSFRLQVATGPTLSSPLTAGSSWSRVDVTSSSFASGSGVGIINADPVNVNNRVALDILIWQADHTQTAGPTSPIPTTTVAVTRAADLANIDGTRFSGAYNQSQGTIYVEMTPLAGAVQAVAASINDGTINNAIRIGQKQSGTLSSIRAIASDGVTDVMAVNNALGNTIRSNGMDYSEVIDGSGVVKFGVASSATGAFLNVGGSENIRSSADSGLAYNARTIGGTLAGAHFGIGRFVIAGSTATINGATAGSVIVSTDGLSFRRVNIPGLAANLNEVTSNGVDQYVAVGNGGVIYTSPDAETWTAQTSGTASALTGAYFFGGRYVAVSSTSGASRYSDNGTSWTAVTGLAASMQDVAHNGTNLWVSVGNTGAIYSSADGITWTSRTSGVTATLNGVHFADGLWVAVGASGTVVTSPDGITWTDRTANSGTTQTIQEVGFYNGKFYYVGASQVIGENTAANIVANVTWTSRTANVGSTLNGIATNGSRLLVCGSAGAIATSDDGITFTSRTGNGATLNGAAFGNGTYVVVGNAANGSSLIATVDPTTFAYTRRVSGVTGNLTNVRFLNGAFFYTGLGGNSIGNSTDGVSWTNRLSGQSFFDITFGAGTYVAIGNAGTRSVSTDGITWANGATGATTQTLTGIDFANGLFVAVGLAGTIITSPNGTTWTARTSGTTVALYAVRWNTRDQCFYAAGDAGVILRSTDGITWENIANDAIGASIAGGSIQANPALGNLIPNAINKVAMRYAGNDFAVSVNGADAVADASGGVPAVNRLSLGMSGTGANPFNGYIRKIQYYPVAKSNADLKVLTS